MRWLFLSLAVTGLLAADVTAQPPADLPAELSIDQPGVTLTQVAQHPQVVTPTGIDIDKIGNLWVVCSHTHFRPKDYDGPEHDEIIVLHSDGSRHVFYDRTDATMDLELGPDGWVYLAERDRILRVRDSDGDGVGDEEQNLAVLKTEADYPHNGLSGMAWHPSGDLIFALGENFWKQWTLTAKVDGASVQGSGEGGIFRCRADGSGLRRIAQGFWNPFGLCVRQDATIFAAENDPGSRPPCRLLHIVEGGDYGFQRAYGNASVHPFVCWDGQLPGTLPMLHALGEAPCGIAPLGNGLIVPSWTDHRIDFYPLAPDGASFRTQRVSLVVGGRHFRPTCITQASETVFYLTDWLFGSYAIHKKGRVWKLEIDPVLAKDWMGELELTAPNDQRRMANRLRSQETDHKFDDLLRLCESGDPFIARAAIDRLSRQTANWNANTVRDKNPSELISLLLALRKASPNSQVWAKRFLNTPYPAVKIEALRWISDQKIRDLKTDVRELLDSTDDYQIFEACLAAHNTLDGQPDNGVVDTEMLLQRLQDDKTPSTVKAFALRLLDPNSKRLNIKLIRELYQPSDKLLTAELTRTLVARGADKATSPILQEIADQKELGAAIRADAIMGLPTASNADRQRLLRLAGSEDQIVRLEAIRALRFVSISDSEAAQLQTIAKEHPECAELVKAATKIDFHTGRPAVTDMASWKRLIAAVPGEPDLEAGRRVFFHSRVGTCWKCHRHQGRGNVVGPDLSATAGDQERLLISLLQPSKDVDPQYHPRMLITNDGKTFTGIMLRDGGGGNEVYRDATGRERRFKTESIEQRKELKTSMMPDGLANTMTIQEIRDLLAFLQQN